MRRGTGAVVGGALHAHYVGAHGHLSLHLFIGKQTANQQNMNTSLQMCLRRGHSGTGVCGGVCGVFLISHTYLCEHTSGQKKKKVTQEV